METNLESAISSYLAALESGNLDALLNLLKDDAMIHTPLYGVRNAK